METAKSQFVGVAICSSEGQWSDDYFNISDIREFTTGMEKVLIVVLHSSRNSICFAADAGCIHGLRFNRYLRLGDSLLKEITLVPDEATLRVS